MPTGSKRWMAVVVCLTLAQIAATASLRQGLALTVITDAVAALLMLALLLAFARNARSCQGRLRTVWILQAVGCSFWLADQLAWILYDIVLRKPMPEMFPGDAVLFMAGVPMLAGLLLRPHLEPSHHSVRLGVLDFLELMMWWIYFYVYLVVCWQCVSTNLDFYNRNYDRLYFVEVLVEAGVLALLLKQSAGQWRRFYAVFLAALVFNYVADQALNRALELKTYYTGSWYDTPYAASFAFFMIVAIMGRGLKPATETNKDKKYASGMASLAVVAVLSLPAIVIATVLDKSAPSEVVRFRVLATGAAMFVMAALVFVKQWRLHEELKQTNETLQEASMTDPLTGIRNRRFFSATIAGVASQTLRAFAEGHDRSTRDLVFYLIDMDNFKEVNDLYGHHAGDRVLVEAARRIGSVVRDSDVLLRWGGEEFLIVSRSADRRQADALAFRVLQAVRGDPFAVSASYSIRRTCSIGWAPFPFQEEDANGMGYEEVLKLADRALNQAKRAGKDQAIGMTPLLAHAHAMANLRRDPDPLAAKPALRAEAAGLTLSGLR